MVRILCLLVVSVCSVTTFAVAAEKEVVRYRCVEWKSKHIHEKSKADTIAETLEKLKCEVKRMEHDGHEDIKYRCEEWKNLQLKTHEEAHKWEDWLKEFGFETQHEH